MWTTKLNQKKNSRKEEKKYGFFDPLPRTSHHIDTTWGGKRHEKIQGGEWLGIPPKGADWHPQTLLFYDKAIKKIN